MNFRRSRVTHPLVSGAKVVEPKRPSLEMRQPHETVTARALRPIPYVEKLTGRPPPHTSRIAAWGGNTSTVLVIRWLHYKYPGPGCTGLFGFFGPPAATTAARRGGRHESRPPRGAAHEAAGCCARGTEGAITCG